jgi:hypothetical protein
MSTSPTAKEGSGTFRRAIPSIIIRNNPVDSSAKEGVTTSWLETADEYFECYGYPGQGRWGNYGLHLPDPILEKVHDLIAERILSQFKGPAR